MPGGRDGPRFGYDYGGCRSFAKTDGAKDILDVLLTGLLPLIANGFGLVWAQHMYTLGLSVKGGLILVSTAFADVLLIGGGAYLLSRPKNSN